MKNEITSRDDEMCSDQQYIIYKHLSPKDIPPLLPTPSVFLMQM